MALQIRRGTQSDLLNYTPAEGEPIFTTDTKRLYVGDGSTPGGVDISVVGGIGGILSSNLVLNNNSIVGFGDIVINGLIKNEGLFEGNLIGNVTGSVYADESTLLVDAINGFIPAEVVQGIFTGTLAGDVVSSVNGTLIVDAANSMFYGNVIGDLLGNVTGNIAGNVQGDVIGSIFADDATTIIVDAINRRITSTDIEAEVLIVVNLADVPIKATHLNGDSGIEVNSTSSAIEGAAITLQSYRGSDTNPEVLEIDDILGQYRMGGLVNSPVGLRYISLATVSARYSVEGTSSVNPGAQIELQCLNGPNIANAAKAIFTNEGVFSSPVIKPGSFADVSARDLAIPAPSAGMIVFILDSGNGTPKFQGNVDGTTSGWVNLN
jgi:hypothetical protein